MKIRIRRLPECRKQSKADDKKMRLYPDPTADLLVSELADFYHLDKDQIFVGVDPMMCWPCVF